MAVVTAAVIGAGVSLYGMSQAKKQQKEQQKFAREQMEGLDPFGQYRPEYAAKLDALQSDPSSIANTPTYKARLMAAERTMASQGYTGSGNALVAAADAGASAYQQEFDNLAMLSGATQGQAARASGFGTATSGNSAANDNYLSGIAGVANNFTNLATTWGGRQPTFNQPTTGVMNPITGQMVYG